MHYQERSCARQKLDDTDTESDATGKVYVALRGR